MNIYRPDPSRESSLAALRKLVRSIERPGESERRRVLVMGDARFDEALPEGGIALGALHEVVGPYADPAANGFALTLIGKLCDPGGHFIWCRPKYSDALLGIPYGPGLKRFGIMPGSLTLVEVERPADVLWAMEECLKGEGLSAVYGEDLRLDLTSSRRLQLAAETSGVTAFALLSPNHHPPPSAALSRWRVNSSASPPERPFSSRWDLTLERCRGGTSKHWIVDWDEAALAFRMAAPISDPSS